MPVVLTGDLNAKDCDELAGIARALVRLLSTPTRPPPWPPSPPPLLQPLLEPRCRPTHPLLWSVLDAPTPATTVTEERTLRMELRATYEA